jgi:tight adherence protein B
MPVLLIAAVLIGAAVLMVFIGLARAVDTSEADRLEEYLSDRTTSGSGPVPRRSGGGMAASAGEMAQGVDKILRSVSVGNRLAHMLHSADLQMTILEYLLVWLLCIGGATALGYVVTHSWLPAALVGVIGALIPYMILRFRLTKRLRAFNNQLPNVLMQLSGSMRAGYGLLQAIDFVAHETPAPAGREFAIVVRDVKLGRSVMAALEDLLDRVESDDLRLVITAMRIQAETGGNLAEILDTVSETIRERVRIKGELHALTSQQRLAGYILAGLPIIVFLILMLINPAYESRLFAPGPTLCLPIGAAISMIMGFLIIRRVIALEV